MARLTAKAQQERQDIIDNAIMLHLLDGRWNELTYKTLEQDTGIRTSTLQGYYRYSEDFPKAIQGKVFPWFLKHLDMTNVESFTESWTESIQNQQFRNVLSMLLSSAMSKNPMASNGVMRLMDTITESFGKDGMEALKMLIGTTVFEIVILDQKTTS